jgi:hypothetical protein
MRLSILTIVDHAANVAAVESSSLFGPRDPCAYVDDLATRWRTVVPEVAGEVVWARSASRRDCELTSLHDRVVWWR